MLDSSGAKKTPKIQPLSSYADRDTSLQHNCQNAQRTQTENKCVFQRCDLWMWSPKKRSFHIWLSLWFAQSPVRPIVTSTFRSCLSSETLLKKKNLINDSFVTLALRRNMALPGRSAPFPWPNHLTSSGLISQEPGAEALWGPRAIISYNLMNSFFISVLQPTPNTSSASRSTCKPRTVWRSLVLGWGPLL